MGLTLSHITALRALRRIRAAGVDVGSLEPTLLVRADPALGKRWTEREFAHESWVWQAPRAKDPVHVLVASAQDRIRYVDVRSHVQRHKLPAGSVLHLDERASMVCPELLFVQMAQTLELPQLVALGNELCGNFCCDELNPVRGEATLKIPQATTVERLVAYLREAKGVPGLVRARTAVKHVCDNALSVPEAVLAAVYSLPAAENGYGMGPLTLNDRFVVEEDSWTGAQRTRMPDIMFSFAPMGINYDGEDHLDLQSIVRATEEACNAEAQDRAGALGALEAAREAVRAKYVDDIRRNRELLAAGKVVLPLTKEDLYVRGGLNGFTQKLIQVAHNLYDMDISEIVYELDDTERARDRWDVLSSLLFNGWDS